MSGASATDRWLADSPLPPLDGGAGTAERLVLLLHYGVDFGVWGGSRRVRYWAALAERVKAATYAGPSLLDWWTDASRSIVSEPRDSEQREEIALLLASENPREVLTALRQHAEVLVMRVRVLSENRRSKKAEAQDE